MTPTARSLKYLRALGWQAEVVERWIPRINVRKDLFSWFDAVAANPTLGIAGVQVSTSAHKSARLAKARGLPGLIAWRLAGGRVLFHGWRKLKGRWTLEEIELVMDDLVAHDPMR